jgi:hypothetical protein
LPHLLLLLLAFTTHLLVLASSFLRFRDHTQWHNTVGRTPLDEWSARRRDLYLTSTQHSQRTNIHALGGIRTRNLSRRAERSGAARSGQQLVIQLVETKRSTNWITRCWPLRCMCVFTLRPLSNWDRQLVQLLDIYIYIYITYILHIYHI